MVAKIMIGWVTDDFAMLGKKNSAAYGIVREAHREIDNSQAWKLKFICYFHFVWVRTMIIGINKITLNMDATSYVSNNAQ